MIYKTNCRYCMRRGALILGWRDDIGFRHRVCLLMKISKDELQVMTFTQKHTDALQEMNTSNPKKKKKIFSLKCA